MSEKKSQRVAIYVRFGSMAEASSNIEKNNLFEYAKKQGLTNLKIYQDTGFSGLDMKRPAFNKMMDDIKSGKISMVLTRDMARISRNIFQVDNFMNTLKRADVKIRMLDESHAELDKKSEADIEAIKKFMEKQQDR